MAAELVAVEADDRDRLVFRGRGHIHLLDQFPDFIEHRVGRGDDQGVGAGVDADADAVGRLAAALPAAATAAAPSATAFAATAEAAETTRTAAAGTTETAGHALHEHGQESAAAACCVRRALAAASPPIDRRRPLRSSSAMSDAFWCTTGIIRGLGARAISSGLSFMSRILSNRLTVA